MAVIEHDDALHAEAAEVDALARRRRWARLRLLLDQAAWEVRDCWDEDPDRVLAEVERAFNP